MSAERQRSRIVASLVLASFGQDFFLLLANLALGFSGVFRALSTAFQNFARTFAFLFNDQSRKYADLTGGSFAGGELGTEEDDDGDD